jgi:tetratricopeptide (TPR) repeat protein
MTCPSPESLGRLGTVTMGETEFVSLEKHIQECGQCQAALERMAQEQSQGSASRQRLTEKFEVPALPGFFLEDELGRGSMGVVYQALQPNLARHVAIKFLKRGPASGPEERSRWLREAQALSRVRDRGIVQIFEIGEADGWLYLVLELIRGGSLKERLSEPLPPKTAARFVETMARAVAAIHAAGLLHLDLKPSNILLDGAMGDDWNDVTPMIADFGISRLQDEVISAQSSAHGVWGTPPYMAPEQTVSDRGKIGTSADVYALGATLYHLLTGRPPFLAASVSETLDQVRRLEPVPPRQLNSSIDPDLENICLKCLRKSPNDRYASAAELAADLRRFVDGVPVLARPVGLAEHVWRWCRRKPGTATLAGFLLVALVGGVAGIALQWREAVAARKIAQASDVEAQQLLGELIETNPAISGEAYRSLPPSVDPLVKAASHCNTLLERNPGDIQLRIALTKVCAALITLYEHEGKLEEADERVRQARELWESVADQPGADPVCRNWLATTYSMGQRDNKLRELPCLLRALAIWEELADEQPDDLELIHKVWGTRFWVGALREDGNDREALLPICQRDRAELAKLLDDSPNDRTLRRRLAMVCFLLGEIYAKTPERDRAPTYWREAYKHYRNLADGSRNDLLNDFSCGLACSRLIQGPDDPHYREAVSLLERARQRALALVEQHHGTSLFSDLLVHNSCCLVYCHAKVGQTARAEQMANEVVRLLSAPVDVARMDPATATGHGQLMVMVAQGLREAHQPAAALQLARKAAAFCTELAQTPSSDPSIVLALGLDLGCASALANQLGEPQLALQQADLGLRVVQDLIRLTPHGFRHHSLLSLAWERIAKARWSLGRRAEALVALRESAAAEKQNFDREPANSIFRAELSRGYDRLAYFSSEADDVAGAADAILKRTSLWPDKAAQLAKSADDFMSLAEQVSARSHGTLSSRDQAERDHYLAESARLRRAADAASQRATRDLSVGR